MGRSKKTGLIGRPFQKGHKGGGRRPDPLGPMLRQLSAEEFRSIADLVIRGSIIDCEKIVKDKGLYSIPQVMVAKAIIGGFRRAEFGTFDQILNRVIGRVSTTVVVDGNAPLLPIPGQVNFEQFCEKAGYHQPYPLQNEMREFGIEGDVARLILGARGYGKTDYVVILGVAYKLFLQRDFTVLLVTKSEERNAAILEEIRKACTANGMKFEKSNSTSLRVLGHHGKDHSVASVTIGSTSIRGRHPKLIIMDDPVTEEDVSEATRRKVQRVYNELSKLCANLLVIGQPVHKADLYGMLRPLLKRMEVVHGSIPELDHDLEAQRLAGVSEESIQASYFLKVISENPSPFENVKQIDSFPREGTAVAFIDPSFEGGDFTALTIAKSHFDGVAIQGHVYKKAWNHCIDEMVAHLTQCNVKRICFETNSLGDMPISLLRDVLPNGIGVVGKKSTGHKHSRIMNAGVFAANLHLAKTSDRKYIEQVTQYEYGSKFDDAPDSLASLLEWLGLIRGKKV